MSDPRVPIFDRLPAIHRIRDAEQRPPDQLRAFAGLLERALGEIHGDIEALYHDLFIDTCAEWVIPYIADLLGTSHLSGDPWTLRAEVADTIRLRRRKGTRAAIELLAYDLTGWPVHAVEMRDRLVWSQHLNHQRPDAGGRPPLASETTGLLTVPRGGTVTLRHPATLSLLDTPFDPFAHIPDLRPPGDGAVRYNLPDLALFLWRLEDYPVPAARPVAGDVIELPDDAFPPELDRADFAPFAVGFAVHPMAEPVVLFNRSRFDPHALPSTLGSLDGMPGPMPRPRLDSVPAPRPQVRPADRGLGELAGQPELYVTTDLYDPADPAGTLQIADTALGLHLPDDPALRGVVWRYRGANLCAWDRGLIRPLEPFEVAIDPELGRLLFGVPDADLGELLREQLRVSYTYGAVGPIGAHPISRPRPTEDPEVVAGAAPGVLEAALAGARVAGSEPLVIEIADSDTYDLDPAALTGGPDLVVGRPLVVRAASQQRPVIRLAAPLSLRAATGVDAATVRVQLDGIYLTRAAGYGAELPLI
ncbi:MAG TPA: hypothetical protein VL172_20590, partial [Kofleriaceae bacterium]|nr:hypothetical protein [Kofleriaceae bacterium]